MEDLKRKILLGLISSFVFITGTLLLSLGQAKAEVANNLTTGLELQWKMNESPGEAALTDSSASGNTGLLYNTDIFTSRSTNVPYSGGANSHSLLLNSTDINDYGMSNNDVPDTAASTFPRTICGWVKLNTTSGDQVAFNYGSQVTGGKFGIYASDGHWWFWGYSSADLETSATTDTNWHHHCVSYDSSVVTYYFDGVDVGSATRSLDTGLSTRLIIGQREAEDWSQPLLGYVDDVRIYSRPLSLHEVRSIANLKSVSIDSKPARYSNNPNGSFEFSTTGTVVSTTCSIDGAPPVSCTSPYTTPALSAGDHSFTVTATHNDATTNTDSYNWTVDITPPETTITQLSPDPNTASTTNFVLTAEEPSTFECSLDTASFQSCESDYVTPELSDGEHSLVVIATDRAGNSDGTPSVHTWTVDTSQNDNDGDGILNQEERGGPNNGDANDDGTADADQASVTSLKNLDGYNYVVVATDCDSNANVSVTTTPAEHADKAYTYPDGVINFTANGCAPPACSPCTGPDILSILGQIVYPACCPTPEGTPSEANVTVFIYGQTNNDRATVRKYNSNTQIYLSVTSATKEDQTIGEEAVLKVSYTVTDGSSFDADGELNDTIVDPVGIGYAIPGAPNTGLGK